MTKFIKNVEVSIRIDELEAFKKAVDDLEGDTVKLSSIKNMLGVRIAYLESEKVDNV